MEKLDIKTLLEPSKKTLIALLSRNLPPETTKEQLDAIIDQEIFNFEYRFIFNPALYGCHHSSIEMAFRKTINQNLSFDEDFGLIYLNTRKCEVDGNQVLKLECKPTLNGDISIARQSGSLEDILEPKLEYDEKTKQVSKCTIRLVTATFNAKGEIDGRTEKSFDFFPADWKELQKASHNQNSGFGKKGVFKTLSESNALYWNYKPIQKDANDAPTPDNPGGINPSFCITKCTRMALKRANLGKNINAKKVLRGDIHRRYVNEKLDEMEEYETSPEKNPDFYVEPIIIQETPVIVPDATEIIVALPNKQEEILKEARGCKTAEDVIDVRNKYKAVLTDGTMQELRAIWKEKNSNKANNPVIADNPVIVESQVTVDNSITADNI